MNPRFYLPWACLGLLSLFSSPLLGEGMQKTRPANLPTSLSPGQEYRLTLDQDRPSYALGLQAKLFNDPTSSLSVEQVLRQPDSAWTRSTRKYPNFGYSDSGHWLQITLVNPHPHETTWVLEYENPIVDHFGMHLIRENQPTQSFKLGDFAPFKQRPVLHHNFVVPFTLAANEEVTALFHVQTSGAARFPITLFQPAAFAEGTQIDYFFYGGYYGLIVVMVLYNLFLFIGVRDVSYLFYSLYISTFCLVSLHLCGFGYQFLWPNSPWFTHYSGSLLVSIDWMFLLMFTKHFLHTRTQAPRMHRVLNILTLFSALCAVVSVAGPANLSPKVMVVVTLIVFPFPVSLSGWLWFKGFRPARYFFLAFTTFMIATAVMSIGALGGFSDTASVRYSFYIASALEIVLLSFALADRISILRQEHSLAQSKLMNTISRHAAELEEKVASRTEDLIQNTKDLEEKSEILAKAIHVKDKFYSIIAHDLRGPIGSMAVVLQLLQAGRLKFDMDIVDTLSRTTNNLRHLLEDLLSWSLSQQGKLEVAATDFDLLAPTEASLNLLKSSAEQKNIRLINQIKPSTCVNGDLGMVTTVIRNLINNAIKFTPENGTITLTSQDQGSSHHFEVIDNGIGIEEKRLALLFNLDQKPKSSSGVKAEVGRGLGLLLVKEFVETNGGDVGVSSQLGVGTKFWFTLPKAKALNKKVLTEALPEGINSFLIAEDNPLHRQANQKALVDLGVNFEFAFDGEEAIQKAGSAEFQVILMDIDMPKLGGIEATETIKKMGSNAKIIALTGYSEDEVAQRFGVAPFDGYLNKPLDRNKLISLLSPLF